MDDWDILWLALDIIQVVAALFTGILVIVSVFLGLRWEIGVVGVLLLGMTFNWVKARRKLAKETGDWVQ